MVVRNPVRLRIVPLWFISKQKQIGSFAQCPFCAQLGAEMLRRAIIFVCETNKESLFFRFTARRPITTSYRSSDKQKRYAYFLLRYSQKLWIEDFPGDVVYLPSE